MGIGVVADFMALGHHPLHEAGIGLGIAADDEEGGRHMLGLEDVENLRRPFRIGAVVEGQRHVLVEMRAELAHDIAGRQPDIGLVVDVAGLLVDVERALAGAGFGFDAQDFTAAFIVDVVVDRDMR